MTRKTRIAVVNSHPIQYFAPLYAYLNSDECLEMTALYCSDVSLRGAKDPGFGKTVRWDVNLLSGYRAVFLGKRATRRVPGGFWSLVAFDVWSEIRSGRYDVVWLHGYAYAALVIAFVAAKSRGIPVFMRCETHLGLTRNRWKRHLRDGVLAMAYRFVDAFLAIGTANRDYYRALEVPNERIFQVPYTVDNARFIAAAALSTDDRSAVRRRFGIPAENLVVLYASKFLKRKHPDDLLRAAARLRNHGAQFSVLMIGSGEMESELHKLAATLGLDNVVFGGFVNQSELPAVYAASDIFVLPSDNEPWGLVVNEAMCAGLSVIVADEVGCVRDLVEDGVNGFLHAAGDVGALAAALERLLLDPSLRRRFAAASLARIQRWSYAECLSGIRAAVQQCSH